MPIRIYKAKRPRRSKVRPSRARTEALQRQMEGGVQLSLARGIRTMQAKVSADALADAYMAQDYTALMRQVPMESLAEYLGPAVGKVGSAMLQGARVAEHDGSPRGFAFDLRNPRVARYMQTRTGALIEGVTDQYQQFVGGLIARRFARGTSTDSLTMQQLTPAGRGKAAGFVLKYGLGLDSRSAAALARRTESGEYTKAQLKQYESDLHVARAERIARTEVAYAMNAGQLAVWDEGIAQGLLPANSMKVWTVDGKPCEICIQMDGIAVPYGEEFMAPTGETVQSPPLHPACRCICQLQTGAEDEGDAPKNRAPGDK